MKSKSRLVSIIFYLVHFLICVLVFLTFSSVLLIYHGPFIKLKEYIVSTSMRTNKDKFFATWFLSKKEIDDILAKTNPVVQDEKENLSSIIVQKDNTVQSDSTNQVLESQNSKEMQVKDITGINIIDITGTNFKGKLMIVDDPSIITIGLAPKLGEVGATLNEIVKSCGAIGGINAGGFLDDNLLGTGGKPDGIIIQDDKIKFIQKGLKIFRIIGFNKDNILVISNSMNLDQINASNLRCAISFGPALILNGKPLVTKGGTTLAPRSAIAQRKDGTILLLTIDGRQSESPGANFMDLQNVLLKYGAYNAANLDGGSSTTMNYQGKTINKPCDITGERSIASAFIIIP
ncbi:MAG: phosphodiester glycosidase family protein [Actinobacteria bacterium]|nr:phosphodiester glycosidase family protein [Actinomycetota bacterium]